MALMPVADALAHVLAGAKPLGAEREPLDAAHRRVLAAPVIAGRSTPAADVSAMDGYAVRAADAVAGAVLAVAGESAAGRPHPRELQSGEAVRIFTGAVLPAGADAIVIQEDTTRAGDRVTIREAAQTARHIRRAGGDFTAGAIVLPAGQRLSARDLALAAAADRAELDVIRRPVVGLVSTGDELVRPGSGAGPHQVILSNIYSVGALARATGAEVRDLGTLPDDAAATRQALRAALDAEVDILVTTGGASVGDHDLVAPSLTALGVDLAVHKVALRPGKPLMFGRHGASRILGLPGNPVSAHVCALLFLVPLIRRLSGLPAEPHLPLAPGRLAAAVKANDQRMDFMRAEILGEKDGIALVRPLPVQDSSMLSVLARADCLLVRAPFAAEGMEGERCEIIRLDD